MRNLLMVFGNSFKIDSLIKSAIFLKENYGFNIKPVYIRDIEKNSIINSAMDSVLMSKGQSLVFQEMLDIEKNAIKVVQKTLDEYNVTEKMEVEIGLFSDIVTEKMKTCDLLIINKEESIFERIVTLLRNNYKSLILIEDEPLKKLEKIIIANDDGVKVNRSCYQFMNLMPEINEFETVSIAKNADDIGTNLLEYVKSKGKENSNTVVDSLDVAIKQINAHDLAILGNLSRSYLFEKIVGKNGLKLLKSIKIPIFIG